jgi:uncharacterized phage infection (PIP) family protein YhgE
MRKAAKVLSVVLIAAAVFGLVGGGLAIKDALSSKTYWELVSGGGDSIGQLEDGLNQLKENEQAYLDGRVALEEGKIAYAEGQVQLEEGAKALEEGQTAYEEGVKTLEEKTAEYEEGVKKLEEGQKAYDEGAKKLADAGVKLEEGRKTLNEKEGEYQAGVAALEQAKALLEGLGTLENGFASWEQGYNGLRAFQQAAAAQGTTLPDPSAENAQIYDSAIAQTKETVAQGLAACDQLDELKEQKAQLEAAIEQMKAAGQDTTELESQLAMVNAGISQIEAALGGQTRESLTQQNAMLEQLTGVPQAVAGGQQQLAEGTKTAVVGMLGNPAMAEKLLAGANMTEDEMRATMDALPSMDYATFDGTMTKLTTLADQLVNSEGGLQDQIAAGQKQLDEGRAQLDAGWAEYKKGLADYEAGKQQLAEAAQQLEAGKAQLAEGEKLLEDGKAQLEDAAKQLEEGKVALEEGQAALDDAAVQIAEGEEQLAAFEDGRDQVIAGLEQAKATETYPGIPSIAERLGPDFDYMKNETDLDMDKGLEVVGAARAFASDTTDAVTKEVTSKAVGAILAIAGSAVALLAGVMGLVSKKTKVSGVMALLGAGVAVAGVIVTLTAGNTFSAIAGSAGPALLSAAGATTAAAGVAQSIPALAAKPVAPAQG